MVNIAEISCVCYNFYMDKVVFKAQPKKFSNGSYLFMPASVADKSLIDTFCEGYPKTYVTVEVHGSRGNKTYDQVKTVFALCSLLYQVNYGKKPNDEQRRQMYESLLWDFADKEPDIRHPERLVPIHLSRMSVTQASRFINDIFNLIIENCDLDDIQMTQVKELFETFKEHSSHGRYNPCDFNKDGQLYTVEEWCKVNNVSMASGVGGDLEIAHIISKGAREDLRDCVWNFLRLTHEEHIGIQHQKGWQAFLEMFPHLKPRVKKAYDLAGEPYPFKDEK